MNGWLAERPRTQVKGKATGRLVPAANSIGSAEKMITAV
jgi:hypothetical protein